MPTFTGVALENLLEPTVRNSFNKNPNGDGQQPEQRTKDRGPRHLYIKPTLYSTPEQAPIPERFSPDTFSNSPYIVNLKRRRGENEQRSGEGERTGGSEGISASLKEVDEEEEERSGENFLDENLAGNRDEFQVDEGFRSPRVEEVEVNDFSRSTIDTRSFISAQLEFFDADDGFSSDGYISNMHSYDSRFESELRSSRLNLLEEIDRRKTAEETLSLMQRQWERIQILMSEAGLSFPPLPSATDSLLLDNNVMEQIPHELFVARFVAEAVGRGRARAEAEEAAATIIESKDQEILRLRDRLQYYETVNHEMSQRKLFEVARRQQERRISRRRWFWAFTGLSIAVGASFVAYSCIPPSKEYLLLLKSGDSSDSTSFTSPRLPDLLGSVSS